MLRWTLVLVGALFFVGCGGADDATVETDGVEDVGTAEQGVGGGPALLRWCNSHKSEQYCPKVCAWYPTDDEGNGVCDLKYEI